MLPQTQKTSFVDQWLLARGLPVDLARQMGAVSFNGHPAFAYRRAGEVIYHKVRRNGDRSDQYTEPAGRGGFAFNDDCLNARSSPEDVLVITEGEPDAIAWSSLGHRFVISVPFGAPSEVGTDDIDRRNDSNRYSWLWVDGAMDSRIDRFRKIILAVDGDAQGDCLMQELSIRLGSDRCWYVTYPDDCKDGNDVLAKHGTTALGEILRDARPLVPRTLISFGDLPPEPENQTYNLGWGEDFHSHCRYTFPSLMTVTGKPGSGKSLRIPVKADTVYV